VNHIWVPYKQEFLSPSGQATIYPKNNLYYGLSYYLRHICLHTKRKKEKQEERKKERKGQIMWDL
jgi:hypothetical protein